MSAVWFVWSEQFFSAFKSHVMISLDKSVSLSLNFLSLYKLVIIISLARSIP